MDLGGGWAGGKNSSHECEDVRARLGSFEELQVPADKFPVSFLVTAVTDYVNMLA